MTTKVVTTFDSSSPPPRGEEQELLSGNFEFTTVFEALRHSQEVAENAFSRCAKKLFRDLLTADGVRIKLVMPDEDPVYPIWLVGATITVHVLGQYDEPLWASYLENLVSEQADLVHRLRDENGVIRLIGPLSTRISEIGDRIFSFSLKQKWSLDG
jgi:hypothetical protein